MKVGRKKYPRGNCPICGVSLEDKAPEVDHIVPLARGGSHTWDNVACACRKRNQSKGVRLLGEVLVEVSVQLMLAL